VARTYKNPIVRIDVVDLEVVFRGVKAPSLGVGTASGESRAKLAAQQALREAGSRVAEHALIVLAFPPGDRRLSESKLARSVVLQQMEPDTFINCGVIEDERLARGTMRVSVLLG
jgi:cell division GTPase FtsZ